MQHCKRRLVYARLVPTMPRRNTFNVQTPDHVTCMTTEIRAMGTEPRLPFAKRRRVAVTLSARGEREAPGVYISWVRERFCIRRLFFLLTLQVPDLCQRHILSHRNILRRKLVHRLRRLL